MVIPILVVVLLVFPPSSSARKLQQQPAVSEFPRPLPDDLPCHCHPPPPPSPPPQPHQPKYLHCPPPPQSPRMPPETTYLYYSPPPPITFLQLDSPFPPHPGPGPGPEPEFQPPHPADLPCPPPPQQQCPPMPPKTTNLYYSPPPPMTYLQPEFPLPLQPTSVPEFSSPAPSSYILRWLSGLGGAAVVALLLVGCRMILIHRATPTLPVQVEMQGMQVGMEGLVFS